MSDVLGAGKWSVPSRFMKIMYHNWVMMGGRTTGGGAMYLEDAPLGGAMYLLEDAPLGGAMYLGEVHRPPSGTS